MGVPKIVKANYSQSTSLHELLPFMGEASGLNRLSLRTGRYQRFGRKTDAKSQ
jgi:hypothetical protein